MSRVSLSNRFTNFEICHSGADAQIGDEDEETPLEKARDMHLDDILKLFNKALNLNVAE